MNQGIFPGAGLKAVDPSRVIDLTNAAEDYLLRVGETAKIHYQNTTTVPLHICSEEGVYEVVLHGNVSATAHDNWATLNPNSNGINTFYADIMGQQNGGSVGGTNASGGGIFIQDGALISSKGVVTTFTSSKSVEFSGLGRRTSSIRQRRSVFSYCSDTTTPWTTLGTINLGGSQSGVICIRRML
jgi:hypothetical protein